MRKPQRSKKHKKMKAVDPFYKGDRLADRKANWYNLKPTKKSEGEFAVRDFKRLKHDSAEFNTNRKSVKRRNKSNSLDSSEMRENLSDVVKQRCRPLMPTPAFSRRPGESDETFMRRVDDETFTVVNRAKFEDKFGLRDDVEISEDRKESIKRKEKNKKRLSELKEKLKQKKVNKKERRVDSFDLLHDKVKFGEVVSQPPSLTAFPRKAANREQSTQLGNRKLLLSELVDSSQQKQPQQLEQLEKRSKKRKLCLAEEEKLSKERERCIAAYRAIKQTGGHLISSADI